MKILLITLITIAIFSIFINILTLIKVSKRNNAENNLSRAIRTAMNSLYGMSSSNFDDKNNIQTNVPEKNDKKPYENNWWVENEMELIRKTYKNDNWALSTCQKAYDIYYNLCSSTESGFDHNMVMHFLEKFSKFRPIVPISDDKNEWIKTNSYDNYEESTAKRCGYFKKIVTDDGDITYTDITRCTERWNISSNRFECHPAKTITTAVMDQVDPITLPYKPGSKDWIVYSNIKKGCEDDEFLELRHILKAEKDDGTIILINRYFMLVNKDSDYNEYIFKRNITVEENGFLKISYYGHDWREITENEYSDLMEKSGYIETTF